MKILLLSFYYPPDLSAGSFRAEALVKALRTRGADIDVITTSPNRYHSLQQQAAELESLDGATIHRIALPDHKSGMADQSRAFLAYALAVRRLVQGKRWDVVVATSSRLMTAALGAYVARKTGAPLYLDIRDLFTDTMDDVLAGSPLRHLIPFFRMLERRTFRSAAHINLVSGGFLPYVRRIAPQGRFSVFTNGIDRQFLETDFSSIGATSPPLVVYAGNIGEGQGLHKIVPEVARRLAGQIRFRVIGDGGKRRDLLQLLEKYDVRNVDVLDAMPRAQLLSHYRQADILFLHLNDYAAFHKVLPSKLFEYAATGKPILAGVAGYARELVESEITGAACFSPCAVDEMIEKLQKFLAGNLAVPVNRADFRQRYARDGIMSDMAASIMALGHGRPA